MDATSSKKKIKIVITGGHHTPALAVLKALQKQFTTHNQQLTTFWFGHRYSMAHDRSESLEYQEVKSLGIEFYDLKAPKFYRQSRLGFAFHFFWAGIKTFFQLLKIRPALVISFGGYLAVPVVLAAWILRIESVTHEQTTQPGLANRFIARFCRKIFISFASSAEYFPKNKTVLTGNPLRREIFQDRGSFKFNNQKKTVYITGGKQGAHQINELVGRLLRIILERYNLIHQCGSFSLNDDFTVLSQTVEGLSDDLKKSYTLQKHFDFSQIGSVLARADFVVSRAGANIVCELAALRKKSLLIPLPGSSHGEQLANAKLLSKVGLAVVLDGSETGPESFMGGLKQLENLEPDEEKINSEFFFDGDKRMAEEVVKLIF